VIGRMFGLGAVEMPRDHEDFERYMQRMVGGPDLHVTPRAREVAVDIVLRPPVALHARPLVQLANFVTVGLLPARLRRGYGLRWDPAREVVLRGGAEYAKRVLVPLLPGRVRLVASARAA